MKRFITGLVLGLCIAMPITVIADSMVGKRIETEVAIKLDGEYLPINAIGLEGRTYAPVRAFAEALGKEVDWDGEVIIRTPTNSNEEGNDMDREWTLEQIEWEIKKIENSIYVHKVYIESNKNTSDLPDEIKQALIEAQKTIEDSKIKLEELKKIRDELLEPVTE